MITFSFTIHGNETDPNGNARPKLKKTGKQFWTPEAQRYEKWKQHVKAHFLKPLIDAGKISSKEFKAILYVLRDKPLDLANRRARMDIKIYWADNAHGDPENIFGSIADALFKNDKNLAGSFDYELDRGKGRVEAIITIHD